MNYTNNKEGLTSFDRFWSDDKKAIYQKCEEKNCRLFYDNLQQIYFVVKKFNDGSILHTRETEIYNNRDLTKIDNFINQYQIEL